MSVRHDNRTPWAAVFLAAIAATIMTMCGGCGGPPRAIRTALDVTAETLVTTDRIVADQYEAHRQIALAQSSTLAEYESRMSTLNRAEAALRQTHTALLVADAGVDAWAEGTAKDAKGALACVADAVRELVAALDAAHVPVPSQIGNVLSLAPAFLGTCPHGAAP